MNLSIQKAYFRDFMESLVRARDAEFASVSDANVMEAVGIYISTLEPIDAMGYVSEFPAHVKAEVMRDALIDFLVEGNPEKFLTAIKTGAFEAIVPRIEEEFYVARSRWDSLAREERAANRRDEHDNRH